MKLFYVQSPYYWRNLYTVAEELGIEAYEILVDEPVWPTEEYDNVSKANKIRLWNEEEYGSDAVPHNRPYLALGIGGDASWIVYEIEKAQGVYTQKIKDKISYGDDIVLAVTSDSMRMIEYFQSLQKEYKLRLHYIVWQDFHNRTTCDELLVRFIPYAKTATTMAICNSYDLCKPYIISFDGEDKNEHWKKDVLECNEMFLDIAHSYFETIKQSISTIDKSDDIVLLYESDTNDMKKVEIDEIDFVDSYARGYIYETITPGLDNGNCKRLNGYRKAFGEKYGCTIGEIDERKCEYKSTCRGACKVCDGYSMELLRRSTLSEGFTHYELVRGKELLAPINGIDRMRIDTDGRGIRSLILMDTCYLNCKHCINKRLINRYPLISENNVMELAAVILKDVPYFEQTGGGVTFGGGEPLIFADYIHQFHEYVPKISINVETSLNVEQKSIEQLIGDVEEWIIDIKDMNPDIYYKYTDAYNYQVLNNIKFLLSHIEANRIICRVPLISGYNTKADIEASVKILKDMGVERIEVFEYQ